ncbi:sec-C motif domain protein [Shewanella sediminis HAW-EB3]|uniref:Sec-C motif domain protein n=1 Tax=Shewanella sediminis (strain HAW-EB3) TaxID=425104 RepID=A8FSQ1_SHESH|nr:aspartyl/asparaginyl beta-hydroxylase domain-containing protein [Shewanella sediminis]ABV35874.1 sec-C motif domain protein [Shewanella sediminis HAW-EB3]
MQLENEFYKLPLTFDVERLKREVLQFDESDWAPHHEHFEGNSAIPLISVGGGFNNEFKGEMSQTPALTRCSYIQQAIASFGEVVGRSRLMRLAPGSEVPLHCDINYHWHKRVRIHIPIVTEESVIFHCGEKQVHMAAGDCWIFDSWKHHKVINNSDCFRVHLVIDIIGSSRFWSMIRDRSTTSPSVAAPHNPSHFLAYSNDRPTPLKTEKFNFPVIMSPSEIENLTNELHSQVMAFSLNKADLAQEFIRIIKDFSLDWQELWSQFEAKKEGWPFYHQLRQRTLEQASVFEKTVRVNEQTSAMKVLVHLIIAPSMSTELAQSAPSTVAEPAIVSSAKRSSEINRKKPAKSMSRNSPCHCGSGEKFKHCHGKVS